MKLFTSTAPPPALVGDLSRRLSSTVQAVRVDLSAGLPGAGVGAGTEFNPALYLSRLRRPEACSGGALLYAAELESTQTTLLGANVAAEDGVVCVADRQTRGRGRGDNTWDSPPGCLMFSFRTPFPAQSGSKLPLFQYIVSIAAVRASRSACSLEAGTGAVDVDVRIKWPNDIYANGNTKIGGILCQSHHEGGRFVVTTGVGINVFNEQPTTCLSVLAGRPVRRETVLAEFFNHFDALYYGTFLKGSAGPGKPLAPDQTCHFEPLLDEYHRSWLHDNQLVAVDEGKTMTRIEGVSAETGALVARDASDPTKKLELLPDGNRLDFFKGLVSRRI